jgi:hypothetical protein
MQILDMGGFEIKEGDYICYAALLGRCACVRYARVIRLVEIVEKKNCWDPTTAPIRVKAVELDWYDNFAILNKGREISLSFPGRMIRINPEQVPEKVKELLA